MFVVVYVTHASQENAKTFSDQLLDEKLIACSNIMPIQSCYWWNGEVENEKEWVTLLKTSEALWQTLKNRAEELHPYEIPCIMKFTVKANAAYENWIEKAVN